MKHLPSTPMPNIMPADDVAATLAEAAMLLQDYGEMGAAATLRRALLGELKVWDFLWRCEMRILNERAAHTLEDDHRAIVLVREVLNGPWPIFLGESPDDYADDDGEE